jgi:hypothetical protein
LNHHDLLPSDATLAACNALATGNRRKVNLIHLGLSGAAGHTSGVYGESGGLRRHDGDEIDESDTHVMEEADALISIGCRKDLPPK